MSGLRAQPLSWQPPFGKVHEIALSADGATLAVASEFGGLKLIDAWTGELRTTLRDPLTTGDTNLVPITALAFDPIGHDLAAGTQEGVVMVWKVGPSSTAELPLQLPGHRGAVRGLAFDPTGQLLATAGEDKVVDVWSLNHLFPELETLGLGW